MNFGFTTFLRLFHLSRLSFTVIPGMHSFKSSLILFRAITFYALFPIYILHLDCQTDGLWPARHIYSYNKDSLYQVSGRYIVIFWLLFFRAFCNLFIRLLIHSSLKTRHLLCVFICQQPFFHMWVCIKLIIINLNKDGFFDGLKKK